MQSNRRIPKKNLLGTRVSAPWSDGRFYNGVIDSISEQPNGQFMYTVLFNDGYSKLFFPKDIIGPNFCPITSVFFKHGQKVFTTLAGREHQATVVKHSKINNELILEIEDTDGELIELSRRPDGVWLQESRKSPRLSDTEPSHPKKSSPKGIDVPTPVTRNRRRKHEVTVPCPDDNTQDVDEDMQMAAVALQNLSCSPASPSFPIDLSKSPRSWNDQPLSAYRPSPSSPHSQYSASAPSYNFFGSFSTDEGIDVEETMYQMDDVITKKRRSVPTLQPTSEAKLRYKCTWKGCKVIKDECSDVERHIRKAHLGPKGDSDLSDHEEEFYYEEIEQNEMEEMTSNLDIMTCASPTQSAPLNLSLPRQNLIPDLDLPVKPEPVLSSSLPVPINHMQTNPIVIPGAVTFQIPGATSCTPPQYIYPQNSPYSRQPLHPKTSPHSPSTASPKHVPRKSRSDIKKCRKVYGMENRDMWCTQCKWKKACTRFVPE